MDYVAGPVLHDPMLAADLSEDNRESLGLHVIDVLSALHKIDPDTVGLRDLGTQGGVPAASNEALGYSVGSHENTEVPAMDEALACLLNACRSRWAIQSFTAIIDWAT